MGEREPAVSVRHLQKTYGPEAAVETIQDSMQSQFPPTAPLLVLAGDAMVFGYLARRFLRWE